MTKYLVLLFVACTCIALAAAKPAPGIDDEGQEILKGGDTRYYGLPLFWYRRPLIDDEGDDFGTNNGGYVRPLKNRKKQSSLPVYETAGAGWGR